MRSRMLKLGTILAMLTVILAMSPFVRTQFSYAVEDISFWMNPSAQHAFELGNSHFRAHEPAGYDIDRAEYFYYMGARLDYNHPMIFQQIARTSFVRGKYSLALSQINLQISKHPDSGPSAYYIRALIHAFLGEFEAAEADYRHYIELDPHTWAAYNDLAWVLLQQKRPSDALDAIDRGLVVAPENAWLLTSRATALYELARYPEARDAAARAVTASEKVTPAEWALQYKGNDPKTIPDGIGELVAASKANLAKIDAAIASSTASRTRTVQ